MKSQIKFETSNAISNKYRLSYYLTYEEEHFPIYINIMISFAPSQYLKHYQNVSNLGSALNANILVDVCQPVGI